MATYKIVRMYFNHPGKTRTMRRGMTLAEAQRYCQNPETSSTTCKGR